MNAGNFFSGLKRSAKRITHFRQMAKLRTLLHATFTGYKVVIRLSNNKLHLLVV
jgi:hypothetical protein